MSYKIWLVVCILLVLSMVSIGGFTRLTESGLSITEWKPITGVMPPFSKSDWEEEFDKYKNTPEYKLHHSSISYAEFQFIYLVEYFHRLLGRLLGVVFVVGFIYFLSLGELQKGSQLRLVFALITGVFQGFMGWYMVKSGLLDIPAVSHYRLAMHLCCASLLFAVLVYEFLPYKITEKSLSVWRLIGCLLIFLIGVQIFFGGLVAGLKAGLMYNTFPLMNGELVPTEMFEKMDSAWFDSPVFVQFLHRMNSFLLMFVCFLAGVASCTYERDLCIRIFLLTLLLVLQMFFGALTLLFHVPMDIALLHQVIGFVLLGCAVSFLKVCSR